MNAREQLPLILSTNFPIRTQFDQFSKTILDSAVVQHQNRLEAYISLADMMSSVALVNNETWPFFTFPRFEHFGYNAIKQSRTEIVNIVHKVTNANEAKRIDYANDNYEKWLTEGYEIESKKYGGSVYDNIQFGDYHPYITKKEETFVPREERDVYWASWVYSPPPVTDGFINWDFTSNPMYDEIIETIAYLKNETLFTSVKHCKCALFLCNEGVLRQRKRITTNILTIMCGCDSKKM